jgi:hypothetical protein
MAENVEEDKIKKLMLLFLKLFLALTIVFFLAGIYLFWKNVDREMSLNEFIDLSLLVAKYSAMCAFISVFITGLSGMFKGLFKK